MTTANHHCTQTATVAVTQIPCCADGSLAEIVKQDYENDCQNAEASRDTSAQERLEL